MNLLKTQQDSEPEEALETAMAMVASALSDPSRVSILCALMDGRAYRRAAGKPDGRLYAGA